jgi:hypothetical protein
MVKVNDRTLAMVEALNSAIKSLETEATADDLAGALKIVYMQNLGPYEYERMISSASRHCQA